MRSDFAVMLSDLRRERGISQKKAAGDLEISQALLSHYENGVREPKFEFVDKVCTYYGVSADYILGRQRSDAVVIPCESEISRKVAEAALELTEILDSIENESVLQAIAGYAEFTFLRIKKALSDPKTADTPETAALERLYMSALCRAFAGESTEETERIINALKELMY